jgi:hypothetical protein
MVNTLHKLTGKHAVIADALDIQPAAIVNDLTLNRGIVNGVTFG